MKHTTPICCALLFAVLGCILPARAGESTYDKIELLTFHQEGVGTVPVVAKAVANRGLLRVIPIRSEFVSRQIVGNVDVMRAFEPPPMTEDAFDIFFLVYKTDREINLDHVGRKVFVSGYRVATALEAASITDAPGLGGRRITCLGTTFPVKDKNHQKWLTLGLSYAPYGTAGFGDSALGKNDVVKEYDGHKAFLLLSKNEFNMVPKGEIIIPVRKLQFKYGTKPVAAVASSLPPDKKP